AMMADAEFQLQTTDGQTYYGELVGIGAEGVAFETPQKRLTVPLARLSDVSRVAKPSVPDDKPAVWIELTDGSQLVATQYTVTDRTALIQLTDKQVVELATAAVGHVRFQPFNPELASQWGKIVGGEAAGDLIVVHKKGVLDYQPGLLGDITDTTVAFTLDDEKLAVKRSKVAGIVYYHPSGNKLPAGICQLVDASGSRLEVSEATLAGGSLQVTTPAGLKQEVPLDQLAAITARVQYLSDLEPESATWKAYVSGPNLPASVARWFRPRFNEALDGGDLKIGGTVFAKGVALCSRSEIVYRLPPGEFKRLTAVAGIDSRARPDGAVRLAIYGDDRPLLETDVSGTQEPLAIDLDVSGVRRVKIVADFGANGEVMDLFDLCDARILQ
ncbi:MAG TPA: NPCBM/NEW2 domain-containing protein, partial [Pirellulales bacterium]|nr:NPCBM/NEW2 domain-containing protein [Pirellulales bacterium]